MNIIYRQTQIKIHWWRIRYWSSWKLSRRAFRHEQSSSKYWELRNLANWVDEKDLPF